jgi:transcriptional regulator with XRE-family HTH domain
MLTKLLSIQTDLGLNDRQMAERLGVSRSAWNMIRNERIPLTDRVQMAAARAFPELRADLLAQVTQDDVLPQEEAKA